MIQLFINPVPNEKIAAYFIIIINLAWILKAFRDSFLDFSFSALQGALRSMILLEFQAYAWINGIAILCHLLYHIISCFSNIT